MISFAMMAAFVLITAPAVEAAPAAAAGVSADPLPTAQIDGVVWSQAVVNNTVYAGGKFAKARPAGSAPGVNTVTRNNFLAYDIVTGALKTTFVPNLNAQALVVAASPAGDRVYVGGEFTAANGQTRNRIAAYSTATGDLVADFHPILNNKVKAIVVTDSALFVGGGFTTANGLARNRFAAFDKSGNLLNWAPSTDAEVNAMVISADHTEIVAGGAFTKVNGATATGLASLSVSSGALLPWAANSVIRDSGLNSAILSLSTDGPNVYGTGFNYATDGGGGNLEGAFAADLLSGAIKWVEDCHGDTYSSYPLAGVLYTAGHAHACNNIHAFPEVTPRAWNRAVAFTTEATGVVTKNYEGSYFNFAGQPAPTMLPWHPSMSVGQASGAYQAGWSVTGNSDYVVYGGEFPTVNGAAQQGLVRFVVRAKAPNKVGPVDIGTNFQPRLVSQTPGTVRVGFRSNWDRDDKTLTYKVVRDGNTASPICQFDSASEFWDRPYLSCADAGLAAGSTRSYRIYAIDPSGNSIGGSTASIAVNGKGFVNSYVDRVRADGATLMWRLSEGSGTPASTPAYDSAQGADGAVGSAVTRGAAGAVAGDTAGTFNGSTNSIITSPYASYGSQTFSVQAWIKTTSTAGGAIIGFGDAATGSSRYFDRTLYMDSAGRIQFGLFPNAFKAVASTASYRNGQWHQVTGTFTAGAAKLYVDGVLVGQRTDIASGWYQYGFWRAGGDKLTGYPSKPSSNFFNGAIDEIAVYPAVLSAAQVKAQYDTAKGTSVNIAPTAQATVTPTGLSVSASGSGSSDPDGSIAAYAWDFGDGATGTSVSSSHTYAAAGTYSVKLTVTDNGGLTGSTTKSVTVGSTNKLPVAAFSTTNTGLSVAFDGNGSTDTDGTIAKYEWQYGDGGTGTGVTSTHAYATAGTYSSSLKVTDNGGAANTVTKSVVVGGQTVPAAADAFGRTVAAGFGTADTGGAWTPTGAASAYSVDGGAGHIRLPAPGANLGVRLAGVSSTDQDGSYEFSLGEAPTGGGSYSSLDLRQTGSTSYRAKAWVQATGAVSINLVRVSSGVETTLAGKTVSSLTYNAGDKLEVRFQVAGVNPTSLKAKLWKVGQTEPADWAVTATDSTSVLQGPGGVGLAAYVSGSASAGAKTVNYDNLAVQAATP